MGEAGARAVGQAHALGQEDGEIVRRERELRLERVARGAVGQVVADLEEGVLVAVVRLDGKVEGEVALGTVGVHLDGGGQAAGTLRADAVEDRIGRQNQLEGLLAPLGDRGRAEVVNEVALGDLELAVVRLDLEDVSLDVHAGSLGGDVIDGDVAGGGAFRRGDEVLGALVDGAEQRGAGAGFWME